MATCTDCGRRCINRCAKCKRYYCAFCRAASGRATCLGCRTKQTTSKQASQTAQSHSVQVQHGAAYTPPPHLAQYANQPQGVVGAPPPPPPPSIPSPSLGVPPSPVPPSLPSRLMIYAMNDTEFEIWRQHTLDRLEDAQKRGKNYLGRRRYQTATDIAMQRDQLLYEDLIEFFRNEITILREMANQGRSQHSGQTGMLLMYDTHDGKLQP